mgnify:CR=1 FL=1
MEKKYKITGVEEPVNELEEKRAKESKKFAKTFIKFIATYSVTLISSGVMGGSITTAIASGNSNFYIAAAFFFGISMICSGLNDQASQDLVNLYDERETKEDEAEENDSKEKTKCLKK